MDGTGASVEDAGRSLNRRRVCARHTSKRRGSNSRPDALDLSPDHHLPRLYPLKVLSRLLYLWRSSSKCVLLHVLLLLYALCMPLRLFTALVGLVRSARMVSVGMLTRSVVERGNAYAECHVFQTR